MGKPTPCAVSREDRLLCTFGRREMEVAAARILDDWTTGRRASCVINLDAWDSFERAGLQKLIRAGFVAINGHPLATLLTPTPAFWGILRRAGEPRPRSVSR